MMFINVEYELEEYDSYNNIYQQLILHFTYQTYFMARFMSDVLLLGSLIMINWVSVTVGTVKKTYNQLSYEHVRI